ncbi:MAG: sensor histidine kinase [Burkholderiales bacterium]|nr:sensor histidine kinase [Burkholderiales bacterium]
MQARRQHLELGLPTGALEAHSEQVDPVQILGNLLDNVSKFTHGDGTIRLVDEAVEAVGGAVDGVVDGVVGDTVVITVPDNGIGISAEALPAVFEPFTQEPPAIGFNGVGPGIGLTVVRQLTQAHGGGALAHSDGPRPGSRRRGHVVVGTCGRSHPSLIGATGAFRPAARELETPARVARLLCCQARRRRATKPTATSPASSIVYVLGSGTAEVKLNDPPP